jgi:hypothetical protein
MYFMTHDGGHLMPSGAVCAGRIMRPTNISHDDKPCCANEHGRRKLSRLPYVGTTCTHPVRTRACCIGSFSEVLHPIQSALTYSLARQPTGTYYIECTMYNNQLLLGITISGCP